MIRFERALTAIIVDGQRVTLSPHESAVLTVLLHAAPRPVSVAQILEAVWSDTADRSIVPIYVSRVRVKLGRRAGWLYTHKGIGYVWRGPVEGRSDA